MELFTNRTQFHFLVLGLLLIAGCGRNDSPGGRQILSVGDPNGSARPNVHLSTSEGDSFQNGDNRQPSHKRKFRMDYFRRLRAIEDEMKSSGSTQKDLQLYFPEYNDLPRAIWDDYENIG